MDEILIEEKKYVSSKRAAKMTGYAKDYVGQLCREGRVPARLVGRSWYVLESAIQDHRFGNPDPVAELPANQAAVSTWESPRYEADKAEILPSINRLESVRTPEPKEEVVEEPKEELVDMQQQETWRAWFDHFDTVEGTEPVETAVQEPITEEIVQEEEPKQEAEPEIQPQEEQEEVSVPIRAIYHPAYQPSMEEFIPRNVDVEGEPYEASEPVYEERGSSKRKTILGTIQIAGAFVAVAMAFFAVIGTGYFDKYILSYSQVGMVAGVSLYNR